MAGGRDKALEQAVAQIKRRFGDGALMRLGDATHLAVETVPTGSLALDIARCGACRVGASPRSTVPRALARPRCASISAQVQKAAASQPSSIWRQCWIRAMRRRWCRCREPLYISQPDTGEQALEIAEALVRSGAVDVIVVDLGRGTRAPRGDRGRDGRSASRPPGAADESGFAQALRCDQAEQRRDDLHEPVAHEDRRAVCPPETTSGGAEHLLYASVRLDVRRTKSIKYQGKSSATRRAFG